MGLLVVGLEPVLISIFFRRGKLCDGHFDGWKKRWLEKEMESAFKSLESLY